MNMDVYLAGPDHVSKTDRHSLSVGNLQSMYSLDFRKNRKLIQ